jgi:hypothetical protein
MLPSSAQWVLKFTICSPRMRVRRNSPPHLCLWVRERTHLPSTLSSNHTSNNFLGNRILDGQTNRRMDTHTNPKPGHTQEDTHYTDWYPHPDWFFLSQTVLTTHPRVHPLHQGTLFFPQTNRTLSDTPNTEGYPDTEWYHYLEFF